MFQKLLLGAALLVAVAACTQQNVTTDPQQDAESVAVINSLARLGNPNNATAITGKPCSETIIAKEKLPAAALAYVKQTYPSAVFVQAEQGTDRDGKTFYEILFTIDGKHRQLHFDAAGMVLVGPGNGPKGGGGFGDHGHKGTPPLKTDITADKLPKPITDYMAANFKGYTFVKAEVVTDATNGAVLFFDVRYTLNGKTSEAHFDVNGNLKAPHKDGHGPG